MARVIYHLYNHKYYLITYLNSPIIHPSYHLKFSNKLKIKNQVFKYKILPLKIIPLKIVPSKIFQQELSTLNRIILLTSYNQDFYKQSYPLKDFFYPKDTFIYEMRQAGYHLIPNPELAFAPNQVETNSLNIDTNINDLINKDQFESILYKVKVSRQEFNIDEINLKRKLGVNTEISPIYTSPLPLNELDDIVEQFSRL